MAKIKNTFIKGIIDKDADKRFAADQVMTDAENFTVLTTDGSDRGVGRNFLGNVQKTNYDIQGAETIGSGINESANKIYNFIKGDLHDYIIEFDVETSVSEIVLQSTTGTRLNFIEGERIQTCKIIPSAEDNGDIMIFSGDSNPPRILNIERAKTWGLDGFTAEEIMLIKAPPLYPLVLELTNSSENIESNNLEEKFLTFTYRYKYKDGYYSAIASWTRYAFNPGVFQLDFETFENLGMLNIQNGANLTFNTGPREVEQIDLIFKESGSQTLYIIEKFKKDEEGWLDDTNQTIQYNNSKIYQALPESEYYRSFDNVPLSAICQTTIGNRVAFANYIEQRNLIDKNGDPVIMDYTLELVSNNIDNQTLPIELFSVDYTFDAIPLTLPNGKIEIDFSDIDLIKGSSIYINFKLKSNVQEIEFESLFTYILEDDYTDLTDLIANSLFIYTLETVFEDYFENNGGITLPDDAISSTVLQTFLATSLGDIMTLLFPVIKYEIDETPDPNTFVYDYFADNNTSVNFQNIAVATSLKSRRSYEFCMIYRDKQGRKTTALTSEFNTLFIDNKFSVNQNQIQVNIPPTQLPPDWADTYKFGIKVNKGNYEQIMASIFFIDGTYRWIKLDGENKNKVKEGDILIVKKDSKGPLSEVVKVKVLELTSQPKDFLEDNQDENNQDIVEPAGLYMKIKPTNFEIDYDEDEFLKYSDYRTSKSTRPIIHLGGLEKWNGTAYEKIPIGQGSTIDLFLRNFESDGDASLFDRQYIVQNEYASFEDWFNAEVTLPLNANVGDDFTDVTFVRGVYTPFGFNETGSATDNLFMKVVGTLSGARFERSKFEGILNIRNVDGYFIFETDPKDENNEVFFETPEVYTITDGEHEFEEHLLTQTYNCFAFGNGAESYQIRDAFSGQKLYIDFCPTAISEDEYRQINRYADITYSEVFNENTNVNKLNEFNLSLANFKDDIEKSYGPIYKIEGEDTNLEVYQEDIDSIVYYGKDLLFNADGTTNLTGTPQVLGQQKMYAGEYGISANPESYASYGIRKYHSDIKRGVVIRKSADGLTEISFYGMRSYFKSLFRDNTITRILGEYDQFHDLYYLNVKFINSEGLEDYVTWVYSDIYNGWLTRVTFNPEAMLRINNEFISFKNGEVYFHNQKENYNTFYNEETASSFEFNFSQEPSIRKRFHTLEIEGTDSWDISMKTDLDSGYIDKEDFELKEGVFYSYIRANNDQIDTSLLSTQGIGNCEISGLVLSFNNDLDSVISVGDIILNENTQLVGTILSKTDRTITLDTVNNIVSGSFVMSAKAQSIENNGLLGYYMAVKMTIMKSDQTEIFCVNSEIAKSNQ